MSRVEFENKCQCHCKALAQKIKALKIKLDLLNKENVRNSKV